MQYHCSVTNLNVLRRSKPKIQKIAIVAPFRMQYYGSITNFNVPSSGTPVQITCTFSQYNKQQTMNNKQQTIHNKQQITNNKQQTNTKQQTTNNKRGASWGVIGVPLEVI